MLSQQVGLYPGCHGTAKLKVSDWLGVLWDTGGQPMFTAMRLQCRLHHTHQVNACMVGAAITAVPVKVAAGVSVGLVECRGQDCGLDRDSRA